MAEGMLSEELYAQLTELIQWSRSVRRKNKEVSDDPTRRQTSAFSHLQAILLDDLPAAVNTKRDPSTARVAVLRRKSNGDLSQTSLQLEIVNRFKNISLNKGTYLKIEHIDGEWQPYAADCPSDSASSESI